MEIFRLKQILTLSCVLMLLFAIYYYMVGYKEPIPVYMEVMRFVLMGAYIMIIRWAIQNTLSRSVFFVALFILFWSLSMIIQNSYLNTTGLVFAGVDSWSYMDAAIRYRDLDLVSYWRQLLNSGEFNIDDLGYSTWVYVIAKPFGNNVLAVAHALMIMNSAVYMIALVYYRRLCSFLLQDKRSCDVATGLCGGFSFLIVTNAVGLKEVLFVSIIIIAMYHIYKYKQTPSLKNFIWCITFIGLTYFFRYAICFALLIALGVIVVTTERNRKRILWLIGLGLPFIMSILSILLPLVMHKSLDDVLATTDYRLDNTGGSAIQKFLFPFLTLFFGPFPNMDRTNFYGFMYGFALLLKCLLSPYFLCAGYWIIRRAAYQYFPLLVFIFCNMLLLIVGGVSADVRYHITYMPFFFLLLFGRVGKELRLLPYIVYVGMIIAIIFMYATRSVNEMEIINDMQYIMVR